MLELKAVEFLKELLGSYSPSGFEQEATRVFKDYCSKFAIEEFTDKMGNVAFKVGSGSKKVMISAHIDEPGLDTLEDLVFDYKSLESKSISGNIQKLYYVNKTFNYIKVDMDYGEYSKHNLDIEDLDTTDLEIIVFNNIIGYYKENKLIKIAKDYED